MNDLMRETKSGDDNVDAKPDQNPNRAYFAQLELMTADAWSRSG